MYVSKNAGYNKLPIQEDPPDDLIEAARWESYPGDCDGSVAAPATNLSSSAAEVLESVKTSFEAIKDSQELAKQGIYALFTDCQEWELAKWLTRSMNQCAINVFLKLPIVSDVQSGTCRDNETCDTQTWEWTQLSYKSSHTFLNMLDQLLTGEWKCDLVHACGNTDYLGETENAQKGKVEENEVKGKELEL
ncbi:hypothetical protein J3R82DRAFT_8610 [Butyriboletus roseoflavus]|nr:hypothetical protein J3R82DRAFT_8610 [Butyriboletus roseoflavus]